MEGGREAPGGIGMNDVLYIAISLGIFLGIAAVFLGFEKL
jgi:hypothetical protein